MDLIKLAFSPCPNDTFIFYGIAEGKTDTEGLSFDFVTADVEQLNHWAMEESFDMIKVSYHAFLYLRDKYELLNSGSALGFSNGPLLISTKKLSKEELKGKTIAIPGEYTTANLLLSFYMDQGFRKKFMVFDQIENAVLSGEADAGVIIHENRFTYAQKGLLKIADLGEYWQNLTGSPIPLGGIIARKGLGESTIARLNRVMRRSVLYGMEHPEEVMPFVRKYAQEMDENVMKKHIGLYVNDFTLDLGQEGRKAIEQLYNHENQIISNRNS